MNSSNIFVEINLLQTKIKQASTVTAFSRVEKTRYMHYFYDSFIQRFSERRMQVLASAVFIDGFL